VRDATTAIRLTIWIASQFEVPLDGTFGAIDVDRRRVSRHTPARGGTMLYYAVVFFIIALIAALFGFGGIATGAAAIAKILFVVFLIVALVTFLLSLARR